ncbi:hypothetical protein FRACYDRAFT_246856 [Fragilariopsis cylindrus CCMP1102]|uniref:Uncharacterized protein n=1 Tax=Fragilariopsis cylindrus CCMP1102 TaxID=635003 RepID=A0A1E7EX18_9STRA|nr:hypothetical protein FRACYDRAFT_246856 [Fragilariopsis cylindrus CCMP1102]|eukprot:OEU10452.1 hypothetical protein FRACYDRAFT_246856 [Fragilariopsis cylindrus CCMP1102]
MANVPNNVGVFNIDMEGIWVFKPYLFLNDTFGHGNMTCWPKCNVCVLEAKQTHFITQPHEQKIKQILFLNHMNRKVVGGKDSVLEYYVDASAPDLFGAVLCNPFK